MEALTTQSAASMLLADKSKLGTTDARFYLAGRMRTRTAAGAVEYLKVLSTHKKEAWDARVKLSLDLMSIYRDLYPRHYAASQSPAFSTAREHEFYRLVNEHLFPLVVAGDRRHSLLEKLIERDPDFLLPAIPVMGTQQHDWLQLGGCCPWDNIQLVFQLVLVLAGHPLGRRHRSEFLNSYGLDESQVAPQLGAYAWTHFNYWCAVAGNWLSYLPLAFKFVGYKTGSLWLDIPPGQGPVLLPWTRRNVGMLFLHRRQAEEINQQVLDFDRWLRVTGRVGVILAIQMWNDAYEMEAESGLTGVMRAEDLQDALERLERE
ncbi:MAG TPA: hypothetical protein VF717_09165 [Pyrinomonadaceae bacterium]|jgi:hypothetical protein